MTLQEFVTGLSVLARGTVHEKLQWAFSLYDTDGDGVITRDELLDVVSAIYDLMGKYAEPVITPDTASEHVERVFQVTNCNVYILRSLDLQNSNIHKSFRNCSLMLPLACQFNKLNYFAETKS